MVSQGLQEINPPNKQTCATPVINAGGRVALDPAVFPYSSFPILADKKTADTKCRSVRRITWDSRSPWTLNLRPELVVYLVMNGDNMPHSINAVRDVAEFVYLVHLL